MLKSDNSEDQDRNSDIIIKIEPVNPNILKSKYFLKFIVVSILLIFFLYKHSNIIKKNININLFLKKIKILNIIGIVL